MTTFYLVRHAHADYVPNEHRGLSSKGMESAKSLCTRLLDCDVTVIYASPYLRAVQTIRPVARELMLPVHLELDLRERRLSAGTVDDFASAARASWKQMDRALPGGESNRDAQQRGLRVLQRLTGITGNVVISTHGTLLALALNGLDSRYDYTFWQQLRMPDAFRLDVTVDHRGEFRLTGLEHLEF